MCALEKNRLASCQITYFPVKSTQYIDDIYKVLDIIKSYPVEQEVGILSTTIRGDAETVFKLIKDIFDTMGNQGCNFTLDIMISNICGCQI